MNEGGCGTNTEEQDDAEPTVPPSTVARLAITIYNSNMRDHTDGEEASQLATLNLSDDEIL